jgi:protein O-GlcNAc transferase
MNAPAAGSSIAQMHASAVAHHRAGRYREAELIYRQILSLQPDHADTLHQLGLFAHQEGQQGDEL